MTRTFHSAIRPAALILRLLPAAILAVWFLWAKIPLAALCFIIYLVFLIERMIHTEYVFTDRNTLIIRNGRFSKTIILPLSDIESAQTVESKATTLFKTANSVMLTQTNGKTRFITPMPAQDFCDYFLKRKHTLTTTTPPCS